MKALKFIFIVPVAIVAFAVSCKKDNGAQNNTAKVSTDVAADMAASAVSANSFGFVSIADNISSNAQITSSASGQATNSVTTNTAHQACGTTIADSLNFTGNSNSVTFSAFYKFTRTLNCNNNNPDNVVTTAVFRGSYDGPRISSTDAGTANVTIGGLSSSATSFTINGGYDRKGSFTSKVGNKASGSSEVNISINNVILTKPLRSITGGTAAITISGTTASGSFSFTGNLVFNGNNQATLTVGTSVYIINTLTGAYTKK
ncbi:hypothetical protein ACFS5N_13760 [Mucilaginibacter ximonensis]|uniref:Lipoprotein n=1 Tax=Mucilaginibacter ximonensis TaxID=538021 RepID=A0ABW5YE52_9SPHI